ncbi:L7Ae/L30e/S12e/Gadd45 family ribosomal protein [Gemmatimonadota bacterium]
MRSRRAEALALLGLAQRAGAVVKGIDGTRRCLRKGEARLVLLAQDGSESQRRKVAPLAEARGVPWRFLGNQVELGAALGSGPLTAVAVTRRKLVDELLARLGGG